MEQQHDFTKGPILPLLLRFALPVLLALLLQAMYGAVDLQVVGRFGTAVDISAVSTGGQIMQSMSAFVAQNIGAGQARRPGALVRRGDLPCGRFHHGLVHIFSRRYSGGPVR